VTGLIASHDHAISHLSANLSEQRSYLVTVTCLCGVALSDNRTSTFSGVLDVAIQVFFTHVAALEV
jgi:hypothetical protein